MQGRHAAIAKAGQFAAPRALEDVHGRLGRPPGTTCKGPRTRWRTAPAGREISAWIKRRDPLNRQQSGGVAKRTERGEEDELYDDDRAPRTRVKGTGNRVHKLQFRREKSDAIVGSIRSV